MSEGYTLMHGSLAASRADIYTCGSVLIGGTYAAADIKGQFPAAPTSPSETNSLPAAPGPIPKFNSILPYSL